MSFYADIVKTGRTSITVSVEVYAQRMRHSNEIVKVTEATLTYVATDEERQPADAVTRPSAGPSAGRACRARRGKGRRPAPFA